MSLKQHQLQQQQQQRQKASSGTIGTLAESEMDEADWLDSCTNHHVIASSYQNMSDDPWNHPLLDEDDYFFEASKRVSLDVTETWMTTDDHDATASDIWLDPSLMLSPVGMVGHVPHLALPSSISFPNDDDDHDDDHDDNHHNNHNHHNNNTIDADDLMRVLTSTEASSLSGRGSCDNNDNYSHNGSTFTDNGDAESWHSQFQQRRAHLAMSMAASRSTRSLLSQHVQTRASLQQVLLEIEKSTTQIQQYIVIESVGMAAVEGAESNACVRALPATAEEDEEPSEAPLDETAVGTTMTERDTDVEMEDVDVAYPTPSSLLISVVSQPDDAKPLPAVTTQA